jgi:hypothetical protein
MRRVAMSSLLFVFIHSIINTIKRFFKKPVNAVLAIFLLGFIGFSFFMPSINPDFAEENAPIWALKAGLFAYMAMVFFASIVQGFKNGASMFDMCDINLPFTAPIKQQSVLIYGMIKSLGRAALLCLFLVWQGYLFALFGIDWRGIIIIIALFIITTALCQFLQMAIYLLTFGRTKRKIAFGIGIAALYLPLVIKAIYEFTRGAELEIAAERVINSPYFNYAPILGWMSGAAADFAMELSFLPGVSGNIAEGLILTALLIIAFAGCTVYILRSKADFYEDAIVAGETRFALQRDIAEGNAQSIFAQANGKKNKPPKKLTKTGVNGFGASAIFYKQMRETFREKFFGLWGVGTLTQIGMVVGFTIALKSDEDPISPVAGLMLITVMMMFCQIFILSTGAGMRELYSHYIFIIPENPLKKLIWANVITLFKCSVEAVIIFTAAGIIYGASPLLTFTCAVAFICYVFYLIGLTYAFERIEIVSKALVLGLYFLSIMLVLAPGIIIGVAVGALAGMPVGVLVFAAYEILAGIGGFALAQGILHNMDMPQITAAGVSVKKE